MQRKEYLHKISNEISKVIHKELQRLDLESMLLNTMKPLVREILEKKISAIIDDIDFPLLLKTAIKEILEPIILKSVEDLLSEKLPVLRLIEKTRKHNNLE